MAWPTSTAVAATEYASSDHYNNLRTDMLATMRDAILVTSDMVGTLAPSTNGTLYLWLKGLYHPQAYSLNSSFDKIRGVFIGHRNILSGITATATGWATAPTTLANCTDESLTTVTGAGTSTQTADDTAYLNFDLGATNTGLAFFKFIYGGGTGTGLTKIKHSVNATAWTTAETFTAVNLGTSAVQTIRAYALTGPRYLRITNYTPDTTNAYLTVYEAAFFLDYAAATAAAANTWNSISMTTATAGSGQTDLSMMFALPATAPNTWFLSLMASATS